MSIYFSEYLQNVEDVVYYKNLSIRRHQTDKTVKTQYRLLLGEQSDQGLHYLSFSQFLLLIILQRKSKLFDFQYLFLVFQFLQVFTSKMFVDSLWVQKSITLGSCS